MRRNTMKTVGLALVLTIGGAGVAAAQAPGTPRSRESVQDGASAATRGRRAEQGGGGDRRGPDAMLLRGITLSAQQRSQVDALRARERQAMQNSRGQRTQAGGAARAGTVGRTTGQTRASGAVRGNAGVTRADSAAWAARRAKLEQGRQMHVAELRQLLTPAQRSQFDRNVTELRSRAAEHGRDGRGGQRGNQRGGASR